MLRTWFLLGLLFAAASHAEVTRIEIASQSAFAGGKPFGASGPYVRVIGRVYGELDPSHPANRSIVDLRAAPRNARGKVEYSADFDILRPAIGSQLVGNAAKSVHIKGRALTSSKEQHGAVRTDGMSSAERVEGIVAGCCQVRKRMVTQNQPLKRGLVSHSAECLLIRSDGIEAGVIGVGIQLMPTFGITQSG